MAIIPQVQLFSWRDVQPLGDLERLHLVLDVLPDDPLMQVLETGRGRGRNDYPVRAMWNSIVAGIVFQHGSVESLRRELARNGQLRELCGFFGRVPSAWAYTRFLHRVLDQASQVERGPEVFQKWPICGRACAYHGGATAVITLWFTSALEPILAVPKNPISFNWICRRSLGVGDSA